MSASTLTMTICLPAAIAARACLMPAAGLPVASTITSMWPDVAFAPSAVNVVAPIRAASQPTVRQASRARSGSRSTITGTSSPGVCGTCDRNIEPNFPALIGAGKFGSMFLSQVPHTPGLEVPVIVDLDPERAREACRTVGWDAARIGATTFTADGAKATSGHIEVIVEATGNPAAGIRHARAAIAAGKHIVMVNVEADGLAGPLLAEEARQAGEGYSLAYGDQPALTAEMVDWARATGFGVVAAGKGTKYLPAYHDVTPAGVWSHYGLTADEAQSAGMNPQMFNSFLDGTKSAIEMAAIANATGLEVPTGGLLFPPCGVDDLPHVMRPRDRGGVLEKAGVVEVVSSLERDGRPVFRDLRWGVYVVLEAPNDYAADCFRPVSYTHLR